MPLISLIVPVYNTEKYIEKCATSLFEQTMRDVEYVFVIDASPDSSLTILKNVIARYPNRAIKIIENAQNMGIAATRQVGIDNSEGEYTIHCDSDDWCEPTMLEDLYSMAQQTNADIVVCDYFVNFPQKQEYAKQPIQGDGLECIKQLLSGKLHGSLCNKLVRRSLYTDNNITLINGRNMMEDLTVCVKLFSVANIVSYLPQAYLHYIQNRSSITANLSIQRLRDIEFLVNHIEMYLIQRGLSQKFDKELNYLKIQSKYIFLQNSVADQQRVYATYYQESNRYVMDHPTLPYYYKIAVCQANKNRLFITNIIYKSLNLIKSIAR